MTVSYNVRIWKTKVYNGQSATTYYVRWTVEGKEWTAPFRTKALADSFRSELSSAMRRGEGFDVSTGRPASMQPAGDGVSWYQHACAFVDMKWPTVAATTRRTHAEAMTAVTVLMLANKKGKPDDRLIRTALTRWAFNTSLRGSPRCPPEIVRTLRWVDANIRPVSALARPEILRSVLDGLNVRLDGTPAAASVATRRRKILNTALEYAVECDLLRTNPIPALKWKPAKTSLLVDRRVVANPVQVRTLLEAVREQQRSGPRMVAFYACLYFAAMRPEEAATLAKRHLSLPVAGWGELHLDGAEPHAGKDWTDSGKNRDRRQLKQRARGEVRTVPCPPELTVLIHEHIRLFGTAPDGRLFTGERNDEELPRNTINKMWRRARAEAFTLEVVASPLARTPYDLRHAAVSTWLNGGVPPASVAEWAGHSVEILLKIYAKCLDGGAELMRRRVEQALGHTLGPGSAAFVS